MQEEEKNKNSQQESDKETGPFSCMCVSVCLQLAHICLRSQAARFNAERPRQMSPCAQTPYTRRANTGIASDNRNQSIFNMNKE